MSKVLIWDLPTRLIHWLLTVGFFVCFGIAQFAGEHSRWFVVHMLLGLALGIVVLLRLLWGIIGSRYARFGSFLYGPAEVWAYLRGAFTARAPRFVGHNPGSAYATYAILLLIGLLVVTGLLMSNGSEWAEEVHAPAAYALCLVVAIHIVGVLWHTWRHRENLALTMISGWKEAAPADAIDSARPVSAIVLAALIAAATVGLLRNYDRERGQTKLPLVNAWIHVGESDREHGENTPPIRQE
ncbi:MAG TPA: cytochrome b/b6 domain-containing protein [Lacipirellulaceae bacterium]|nr:cytochrome b/b6 domain-containing protein [Lacipirellulaceae bacterium]